MRYDSEKVIAAIGSYNLKKYKIANASNFPTHVVTLENKDEIIELFRNHASDVRVDVVADREENCRVIINGLCTVAKYVDGELTIYPL